MTVRQLVLCRDTVAPLAVPAAVGLLAGQGLTLVKEVAPEEEREVVAVILGLGRFGLQEAARFPNLRIVARYGSGHENIDSEALWRERGVTTANTANVANRDVAELALALLILGLRDGARDMRALAAEPTTWRVVGRGLSLNEATVGIVGCGNIGLETARLLGPHVAKLLLWNRSKRPFVLEGVDPSRYEVAADLADIARRADAVSIHLALADGTRNAIGAGFFDQVRAAGRKVVLVNTARGEIVDETALLTALEDGTVRTAALDVWSAEGPAPTEEVRALRRHPGVLPTSHLGAFTLNVQRGYAMQSAENILAVLNGRPRDVAAYIVCPTL